MPDDERRPVHAPRHLRLRADELLGLELRAVIGRRQPLALVEVVLAKQALVLASPIALRVPPTLSCSLLASPAVMS
jgi:hypothetical protein